jgi:hypothetical protein
MTVEKLLKTGHTSNGEWCVFTDEANTVRRPCDAKEAELLRMVRDLETIYRLRAKWCDPD